MTSPHKNQHRGGLNCVDKTPMPVVFRLDSKARIPPMEEVTSLSHRLQGASIS
jgi:hypothetical protein